ncbi:MAG: CD3072 family TudS-related putative desulfidase [Pseudomonadota bacterium]
MEQDKRSRTVVFAAHCLLNQNAKVEGLAGSPGMLEPLVELLAGEGAGVIQMPCPEVACLGPGRPPGTDTREQYDSPQYRETCRRIASQMTELMSSYAKNGYTISCILGVEGSPSCSVARAPVLDGRGKRVLVPGKGIFIEELAYAMDKEGLDVPVIGIPEVEAAGDIGDALSRTRKAVRSTGS